MKQPIFKGPANRTFSKPLGETITILLPLVTREGGKRTSCGCLGPVLVLSGGHEAGDDRQRVAGGRRGQVPSHHGGLTGAGVGGVGPV